MKALLPLAVVMVAGALTVLVSGCSVALPTRTQKEAAGGTEPAGRPSVPGIDARAPADTETATFALG